MVEPVLIAAPTAAQRAAANDQELTGHEAEFVEVFKFPKKFVRTTLNGVDSHEIVGSAIRQGDRAELTLNAGQKLVTAQSSAGTPTMLQ